MLLLFNLYYGLLWFYWPMKWILKGFIYEWIILFLSSISKLIGLLILADWGTCEKGC